MSRYRVEISRKAEKQLRALQRSDQVRVASAMASLADAPRPSGCRSLTGVPGAFRVRVGRFRIIYEIVDDRLLVKVVKVGHRRRVGCTNGFPLSATPELLA